MRALWSSVLVALVLVSAYPQAGAEEAAGPLAGFSVNLVSGPILTPCDDVVVDPMGDTLLEGGCNSGEIRPGAWGYGCTFDFVVTDGIDLYIGTAGHCGGVGKRWATPGVGTFGTTVFSQFDYGDLLNIRDWAFIKVDADKHGDVNPTMYRFAGPFGAPGVAARQAVPGDAVLQFGHGAGFGQDDGTKGRAGVVVAPLGTNAFVYAGVVGGGDSGSPVRFATGQAAGIAVAYLGTTSVDRRGAVENQCALIDGAAGGATDSCIAWETLCPHLDGACVAPFRPGTGGPAVIATSITAATGAFSAFLGRDVQVVAGALPGVGLA